MEKDLISVVVPIYNVENYLKKCIDTILYQTYQNLEIILVDDGSTDSSSLIADSYQEKEQRIQVIHKKNGGLSDARNAGLKVAKGEFICFIDSDDYIENNYIQELYQTMLEQEADIAICGYQSVYEDGTKKENRTEKKIMTNQEALQLLFTKAQTEEVVTWNKLYKTALFLEHNIQFPVGKLHEDNFTTYQLLYYANKIAYTDQILYNYRQRSTSIVGTYNHKRLVILDVIKEIEMFFQDKPMNLSKEIEIYELLIQLGVINLLIFTDNTKEPIFLELIEKIRKKKKEYLKNPYLRKQQKISIIILNFNHFLYAFFRKRFKR